MSALAGLKIVEMAGIGPAPYGGMLLADLGADVLRIDRLKNSGLGVDTPRQFDLTNRNKRSIAIDLKSASGKETAKRLIDRADALIEGFRPGVMERLGLGPDDCLRSNPRLVYGRVTGWGQNGPLAKSAGHDINYIALTGALHSIGSRGGPPVPPLSLLGDFGGGGVFLAFGIMCAIHEAKRSGVGQVVDAAMLDGVTSLMTTFYGFHHMGIWTDKRGDNIVDGGAPFYGVYETKDGRHVTVGAIEPAFYKELLDRMGLDPLDLPPQSDRAAWPQSREKLAAIFLTRTRDEWVQVMDGADACFAPVLNIDEASLHAHNRHRDAFLNYDGLLHPAPAPRLSRTPGSLQRPPPDPDQHHDEILAEWGVKAISER